MNLFGQQNDFLVKIVFLIVQYATDHCLNFVFSG